MRIFSLESRWKKKIFKNQKKTQMSITLYIGSGNWNTHLEGSSFFFFFFCFNHASFQQQIRIWGLFVFTIGVLKDSLWDVLLFLKRKLRPKLVWPGWTNGDSPICILLVRTLTLCVEEQVGGGIAYTCVWELSGASAYEGFLLSGSDTGQRRFSHLGWPWCTPHGSHSQSVYPRWGLAAKSPVSSFLFPKLFSPAIQRVQHISQCWHSSVGEFSFMVSSTETTEAKFLGSGNLPGSCHQSLALD